MEACLLCLKPSGSSACYVRLNSQELPSCRSCWEQLLLDPGRVVRQLKADAVERVWMDPAYRTLAEN